MVPEARNGDLLQSEARLGLERLCRAVETTNKRELIRFRMTSHEYSGKGATD